MADEQFGQSWPPKPNPGASLGTGEGESPLVNPLAPKMDARTMASDTSSLKESGGVAPRSYVPPPSMPPVNLPKEAPREAMPQFNRAAPFQPSAVVKREPAPLQPQVAPKMAVRKKSKKGLFFFLFALLIVGGLGYFFVYPFFFGEDVPEPITEAPSTTPPTPTVPEEPVIPSPPSAAPGGHISLFGAAPADASTDLNVSFLSSDALREVVEFSTAEVPLFKELVLRNAEGNLISFGDLMGALLPTVFDPDLISSFDPDGTIFVYSDSKGTWLGFVGKPRVDVSLADVQNKFSRIEAGADLSSLFLIDPGTQSGNWKGGQTSGISNRYVSLENAFSLNYGWVGNNLLISTSYEAFKEAIRRIQ